VEDFAAPGAEVDPMLKETNQQEHSLRKNQENGPILDLLCHSQESLLDVGCVLRRSLKERDVQLVGKFLEKFYEKR
jgi:hypothetical protein